VQKKKKVILQDNLGELEVDWKIETENKLFLLLQNSYVLIY
tara:strand:- start:29 stop:151 length:123 start_codon:yes stop_codon:yes gene_type:complete